LKIYTSSEEKITDYQGEENYKLDFYQTIQNSSRTLQITLSSVKKV